MLCNATAPIPPCSSPCLPLFKLLRPPRRMHSSQQIQGLPVPPALPCDRTQFPELTAACRHLLGPLVGVLSLAELPTSSNATSNPFLRSLSCTSAPRTFQDPDEPVGPAAQLVGANYHPREVKSWCIHIVIRRLHEELVERVVERVTLVLSTNAQYRRVHASTSHASLQSASLSSSFRSCCSSLHPIPSTHPFSLFQQREH